MLKHNVDNNSRCFSGIIGLLRNNLGGYSFDKGKPLERVGRKATGLIPSFAGYGSRAPGRGEDFLFHASSYRERLLSPGVEPE